MHDVKPFISIIPPEEDETSGIFATRVTRTRLSGTEILRWVKLPDCPKNIRFGYENSKIDCSQLQCCCLQDNADKFSLEIFCIGPFE